MTCRRGLRQDAARAQCFLDQGDQFIASKIQPVRRTVLRVFGHHRLAGFHAVVGFYPIAPARFEQFSYFVSGKNFRPAQQLGHQRDAREVLHGFHLEKRLVHILAVANRAVIAEQNGVVLGM